MELRLTNFDLVKRRQRRFAMPLEKQRPSPVRLRGERRVGNSNDNGGYSRIERRRGVLQLRVALPSADDC